MTSQQIKSRLAEAIAVIADCERYLETIDCAATGWHGIALHDRVVDFMMLHRQEQRDGGGL